MLVERFLCWMTTADTRQRAEAASLLVRLHGDARLGEQDRDAIEAGLTVLLDDPETEVRQALAEAVALDNQVPHHLALTLAHDVPEVAAIIVAGTTQLLDGEMVDLVAVGGPEVQRAAAGRATVSPALAAALAEVGDRDAVVELLLNSQAVLAEFSHLRILGRLGLDSLVRHAMEVRDGLTIAVRQMLARLAAADSFGVPLSALDGSDNSGAAARDAVEKETVDLARMASDEEVSALVAHLRRTAQLTPALILRAAVTGEMRLAGEAIAHLAGVSAERAFLVMERGEEAVFTALARKAGLPERTIPALAAATEVAREVASEPQCSASYAHVRRTVERVVDRYRDCRDDEMDDLIAAMRRYAGEAARDAARRYIQRTVAMQPGQILLGPADVAEALLAAPSADDDAIAPQDDFATFTGLGTAFDDDTWQDPLPEALDLPLSFEDAVAAAVGQLDQTGEPSAEAIPAEPLAATPDLPADGPASEAAPAVTESEPPADPGPVTASTETLAETLAETGAETAIAPAETAPAETAAVPAEVADKPALADAA